MINSLSAIFYSLEQRPFSFVSMFFYSGLSGTTLVLLFSNRHTRKTHPVVLRFPHGCHFNVRRVLLRGLLSSISGWISFTWFLFLIHLFVFLSFMLIFNNFQSLFRVLTSCVWFSCLSSTSPTSYHRIHRKFLILFLGVCFCLERILIFLRTPILIWFVSRLLCLGFIYQDRLSEEFVRFYFLFDPGCLLCHGVYFLWSGTLFLLCSFPVPLFLSPTLVLLAWLVVLSVIEWR